MGYKDGAVSGMVGRLMPVGFMPEEAQCLGQAAYLPPGQIASNYPRTVRPQPEVSHLINLAIKGLSQNPYGPKAHLGRIVLWESIFGKGSWHEELEYTEDDRNYMAVFEEALLGDLGPTPALVPAQVAAQAVASPEVPVAPAPIRVAAAPKPIRPEKLPTPRRSRKGRGLFITAGVLSILFGGFNLMILIGVMLDSGVGNGTPFSGFAAFFIFVGTFGMLIIGGAAACGVNTLVGKVMLLIASLSMMTGHIVLGATGWIVDVIGIAFAIVSGLIAAFVIGSIARSTSNFAE